MNNQSILPNTSYFIEDRLLKVIDNLLTKQECEDLIKNFESKKDQVKFIDRGIAEYYRLEEDDPQLADKLWNRIKRLLPSVYQGGLISNMNTHFRYSKYEPGMQFERHRDGINQDQNGNRSVCTLNIFLNDNFDGGETDFFEGKNGNLIKSVKPQPGRAALFDGQIYHCGNKVLKDCKYLIRTDVMVTYHGF